MIGDWVHNTHNDQPEQVYEIGSGLVMLDYNDLYEYDEIEPIPLTVEILKSNGFDLNGISEDLVPAEDRDFSDDTYVWQAGKFEDDTVVRVCVYFDYRYNDCIVELETPNITTDSIRLKHVHQLQHALRLCGIEKEIVVR